MPRSKKAELVQEYCRQHPDQRSNVIATWLYERHPGLWPNQDSVRQAVRYYRGMKGERARSQLRDEVIPTAIPKGKKQRPPAIKLPPGKWLVASDIHVPYHDERAVEAALRYGVDNGCDSLLLNGDAFDAYQASHWVRDPRADKVDKELGVLKCLIKYMSQYFKRCAYKIGNHEDRIESYLFMNAPQMPSISKWNLCDTLANELELDDWIMIASKQSYSIGRLNGYHGHELPKGLTNPVSIGRGIWLRTSQSGFAGHWHRSDSYTRTSADKKEIWKTIGVGCLCDLRPSYAPVNEWSQGCLVVESFNNGIYLADNKQIHDGVVY
jgi:hypothetical protein